MRVSWVNDLKTLTETKAKRRVVILEGKWFRHVVVPF